MEYNGKKVFISGFMPRLTTAEPARAFSAAGYPGPGTAELPEEGFRFGRNGPGAEEGIHRLTASIEFIPPCDRRVFLSTIR